MGLRGVFISKGDVCGHSAFLGTKGSGEVLCYLNRNSVFCHGGKGLFYPPWEKMSL